MDKFDLSKYKEKNTKEKVFIEFIYLKCGYEYKSPSFENIYFSLFTIDDFLESLEYYISTYHITAKITAQNYLTFIKNFYEMLNEKYNIRNDIFFNFELKDELDTRAKDIILLLKDTENKNIATDEQCEMLDTGINEFLLNHNIEQIYDDFCKIKNSKTTNRNYNRFVSIIAIKIIMEYALTNLITVSLAMENLDVDNKMLLVNGFNLPLSEELSVLIKDYLRVRTEILKNNAIESNFLFVKSNGEAYKKSYETRENVCDVVNFFAIMADVLETQSTDIFASKTILGMLEKGVDVSTIYKLTNKSEKKCIELQNISYTDTERNNKLVSIFNSKSSRKQISTVKKGFIKCPFCGCEVKAVSDNLVLVKFEEDELEYLACKGCKGTIEKQSN